MNVLTLVQKIGIGEYRKPGIAEQSRRRPNKQKRTMLPIFLGYIISQDNVVYLFHRLILSFGTEFCLDRDETKNSTKK
jgi:hypothetical protein